MEQWRERGYVPDSDEEDVLETQVSATIDPATEVILDTNVPDYDEANTGYRLNNQNESQNDPLLVAPDSPHLDIDVEELEEDDPLQVGAGILARIESAIPALNDGRSRYTHDKATYLEPSSSPDELHFAEHLAVRVPNTPSARDSPALDNEAHAKSQQSSPLSSPLSSIASPWSPKNARIDRTQDRSQHTEHNPVEETIRIDDINDDILSTNAIRHGRSLRQRNAIQLHPYLLENAQYQKLLKARGVQPVRIRLPDDAPPRDSDESQNQSYQDDTAPLSSNPDASFQFPPPSPVPQHQPNVEPTPSHSSLNRLRTPANKHSGRKYGSAKAALGCRGSREELPSNKRRKTSHDYGINTRDTSGTAQKQIAVVVDNQGQSNRSLEGDIFDIPLSPPQSGSPSSALSAHPPLGRNEFRFPRGMTPVAIATPATETRPKADTLEDLFAELLSEESELEQAVEAAQRTDSSTESESTDTDTASIELKQMRRKIKGVLPASWLRLDLQENNRRAQEAARKEKQKKLQREREIAKGVARRISKADTNRNRIGSSRATAFLLSDDSSSDIEELASNRSLGESDTVVSRPNALQRLLIGPDADDDIPEDNRIDYMYPSASRRARLPGSGTTQRAISNRKKGSVSLPSVPRGLTLPRTRQVRIIDTIIRQRRTRKREPQVPKLGILDAPDLVNGHPKSQPQFLRVAARRARSRRDYARQSPSRKFFRLGDAKDTKDANEMLREWRAGTLAPNVRVEKTRTQIGLSHSGGLKNHRSIPLQDDDEADDITLPAAPVNAPPWQEPQGPAHSVSDVRDERDVVDLTSHDGDRSSLRTRTPRKTKAKQSRLARHGFVVSTFKRNVPRPAEPYSGPKSSLNRGGRVHSFHRVLSTLSTDYKRLDRSSRLPLARFLSQGTRPTSKPTVLGLPPPIKTADTHKSLSKGSRPNVRRPRKQKPRHIDAEAVEYRQPVELDLDTAQSGSVKSYDNGGQNTLQGVHRAVHINTVDFDTVPLQIGTYFHESTFVGSGEFFRSLNIFSRNLDMSCGQSVITFDGQVYRWGIWNDAVSSELGFLLESIVADPQSDSGADISSRRTQLLCLYRSIILYVSDKLSFSDPVDRRIFVEKCHSSLVTIHEETRAQNASSNIQEDLEHNVRIETLNLAFANQIREIATHDLVGSSTVLEVQNLTRDIARKTTQMTLGAPGISDIRQLLEENRRRDKRETGIRQDHPFVEAYVVTNHILQGSSASISRAREDILSVVLKSFISTDDTSDIREYERIWRSLYSGLPLQEFDEQGIFRPGSRFTKCQTHWPIVTHLVSSILDIYKSGHDRPHATLDKYLKSLLSRCLNLVTCWGWHSCAPILETIFDFFARNQLHNLHNEDVFGSPAFLDSLDKAPALDIEPRDTCFHVFLKLVASGLRSMTANHNQKKIRNMAWRLLPNHGRVYPKEQPLRQDDLNALRNHHDLLCTLYWAVPDGCRPRLDILRQLVHPATSHKEACSINIHSWSRLVMFKLSTNEDISGLVDFANWHGDFTVEMLKQHALAKTELEIADVPTSTFARQSIESAIGKNQRQIESLINSALNGMKQALNTATNMAQAMTLMEKLPLKKLLGLFNPSVKRLNGVVCHTLDLLKAYATVEARQGTKSQGSIDTSEDSQDYGDWAGFAEVYDRQMDVTDPAITFADSTLRPALSSFISRVFGEDQIPDEKILTTAIETWMQVAHILVKHRLRQWSSYLNPYDGDSWASLRTTDQTRRFMPYFLACLIDQGPNTLLECKPQILKLWIESLVERGSLLKFQHKLTTAILNKGGKDPLLNNLPFSVDEISGQYEISLDEFCQRRLSLLSSVLSNMREHLTDLEELGQIDMGLSAEYCEVIRTLMTAMRRNYEELGSPNGPTHGSYVAFVQSVVEFLQQHSQGICPIDEFFVDQTSFPLPASDPTYVVAKMKSYGVRLNVAKVAKQLVMFVQNVSERAAIDGHQIYLVDQLYKAMAHTYSTKDDQKPHLRSFLLQCVFPAYVGSAFSSPVGWIPVRPLLQATTRIFLDVLLDVNTANDEMIAPVVAPIITYFDSVARSLQLLTDHPGLLEAPTVLLTLTSLLETIIASLPFIDYIYQISNNATSLVLNVEYFRQFIYFAVSWLFDTSHARAPNALEIDSHHLPSMPVHLSSIREFTTKQLQTWLKNDWSVHDGQYFVRRGVQSKRIVINESCLGEDAVREGFASTVETFFGALDRLSTFSSLDE